MAKFLSHSLIMDVITCACWNQSLSMLMKGARQMGTDQSWDFTNMSIHHISDATSIKMADPLVTEGTILLEADRYWMPIENYSWSPWNIQVHQLLLHNYYVWCIRRRVFCLPLISSLFTFTSFLTFLYHSRIVMTELTPWSLVTHMMT